MPSISKGKGGSVPVMHPRSDVPAEINRYFCIFFLHLLILKVGMYKLETLDHMLKDL